MWHHHRSVVSGFGWPLEAAERLPVLSICQQERREGDAEPQAHHEGQARIPGTPLKTFAQAPAEDHATAKLDKAAARGGCPCFGVLVSDRLGGSFGSRVGELRG